MIDDVASIVELERDEVGPGHVRLVNEWRSSQRIPDLLANALGSAEVGWIDRNDWDAARRLCSWTTEPFVLHGSIDCHGTTTYEPAMGGRGARVTLAGEFDLARGALGGLAGALERPVGAFVESIVTTMIPKNTRKVIEAAAALIGSETG